MTGKIHETSLIPRSKIGVDAELNARRTVVGSQLDELVQSIKDVGLLHDVGVRPYGEDKYLLVWGYRRLMAMDRLKMPLIPCKVVDVNEGTAYEMMMAENVHREDVAPWDIGQTVSNLLDKGYDIVSISQRLSLVLGKSIKMNRIHKLVLTCKGLIPELMEVWKRGVSDFGETEAYRVSQLPAVEQQEYFIDLCGGLSPNKRPPGGGEKKKRRKGRPTIRTIELAYLSVRQHEDDEHEDGLDTAAERKAVRAVLQWIIGGRTKCPIKLRKKKKKDKENRAEETERNESVPIRRRPT